MIYYQQQVFIGHYFPSDQKSRHCKLINHRLPHEHDQYLLLNYWNIKMSYISFVHYTETVVKVYVFIRILKGYYRKFLLGSSCRRHQCCFLLM